MIGVFGWNCLRAIEKFGNERVWKESFPRGLFHRYENGYTCGELGDRVGCTIVGLVSVFRD